MKLFRAMAGVLAVLVLTIGAAPLVAPASAAPDNRANVVADRANVAPSVAAELASDVGYAPADSHCPDGYSCFWTGQHYGGAKRLIGAEEYGRGWQPFDNRKYSVKNRFTNKTIWIYGPQIGYDCGYPGQRADSIPGGITWYAVDVTCGGQLARYFVY